MTSRKLKALTIALAMVAGLIAGMPAQAGHNDDDHSPNFKQLAQVEMKAGDDLLAQGSDLAFKNDLVIAGSFEGLGIFKILPRAPYLKQLSFFYCPGGQGDVTVSGNHVFFSVDSPLTGPKCDEGDTTAASPAAYATDTHWEGVRIFDISNPRRPSYVKGVKTACGSHTNVLLPGKSKSYIYVSSYPLTGQGVNCNYATHRKVQIIEFPTKNPAQAKLLDETFDATPSIGCHDITTFPDRKLMAGACVAHSLIWSIKDPKNPELLATIRNENMQIHHSTAMTWDGKVLVLGDEYSGAAGVGGCTGDENSTIGAAWFYDISDPSSPQLLGHHSLPRVPEPAPGEAGRLMCTNHNFNVIPLKSSNKYLLAVSYYMGGISVVDFTDPSDPTEVGHYVMHREVSQDTWAAYWYNGRIYTNDYRSKLGVGAYEFKGTSTLKDTRFFKGVVNPQVQFESNFR